MAALGVWAESSPFLLSLAEAISEHQSIVRIMESVMVTAFECTEVDMDMAPATKLNQMTNCLFLINKSVKTLLHCIIYLRASRCVNKIQTEPYHVCVGFTSLCLIYLLSASASSIKTGVVEICVDVSFVVANGIRDICGIFGKWIMKDFLIKSI